MKLLDHLSGKKIILASKSPRRQTLLKGLNIDFEVRTKDVEERYPPALQMEEIPRYLSRIKAKAFLDELQDDELLITCDTTVHLGNEVLEKAETADQARGMLRKLSGRDHEVITAVTLASNKKNITFHDTTKVWFRELSEEEITYYIEEYKPYDKAGAYGIQEFIGFIAVHRIEGSFFNVMGLPLSRLYHELKNWTDVE